MIKYYKWLLLIRNSLVFCKCGIYGDKTYRNKYCEFQHFINFANINSAAYYGIC